MFRTLHTWKGKKFGGIQTVLLILQAHALAYVHQLADKRVNIDVYNAYEWIEKTMGMQYNLGIDSDVMKLKVIKHSELRADPIYSDGGIAFQFKKKMKE